MLPLDVPTMLLMTAAASATMALSMAAVRPERREGMGLWALALVLHTITYLLFTLRGAVPAWASVVLANTLLAGTFALALAAVRQFQGHGLPCRSHAGAGAGHGAAVCLVPGRLPRLRDRRRRGAAAAGGPGAAMVHSTDPDVLEAARDAALDVGVHLSENLTSPAVFVNQTTAFSDFHGSPASPAATAALSDPAYVTGRFTTLQSRRHVAAV